jgi:hypothetical protein
VALSQRFDQQAYLISSSRSGYKLLLSDQVLAQRADNSLGWAARTAGLAVRQDFFAASVVGATS